MDSIIFCLNCMKESPDYNITTITRTVRVKDDEDVTIEWFETFCKECGKPIFVENVEEANFINLYKQYNQIKGYEAIKIKGEQNGKCNC